MFDRLAAKFLNSLLSRFVDNIQTEQLDIGFWRGDVRLRNLRLKASALRQLDIPVDVESGQLELLEMVVPWNKLQSQPIKIRIVGLALTASPKLSFTCSSQQDEDGAEYSRKMQAVLNYEQAHAPESQEEKKEKSWFGALLTLALNNVQLVIENISLSLVDQKPERIFPHHFVVSLGELRIFTVAEDWQESFNANIATALRKLLHLRDFSIKCTVGETAGYILKPVSAQIKTTISRKADHETPKIYLDVEVDQTFFCLDANQLGAILEVADTFSCLFRQRKFSRLRPDVGPVQDPIKWWKFLNAVIMEKLCKKQKFSLELYSQRRKNRLEYMRLYEAILDKQELGKEDRAAFLSLERLLSYSDILYFRSLSRASFNCRKHQTSAKPQSTGWVTSLFNSINEVVSAGGHKKAGTTPAAIEEEEFKKFFYNLADGGLDIFAEEPTVPANSMKFKISLSSKLTSFTVCGQGIDSGAEAPPLLDVGVSGLHVQATIHKVKKLISFSLDNVFLHNYIASATPFQYIIQGLGESKKDILSGVVLHDRGADRYCPFSLSLTLLPIQIILTREPVDFLVSFLQNQQYREILEHLRSSFTAKLGENLKRVSRMGLELVFSKQRAFALQLRTDEIRLVVPDSVGMDDSFVFLVSIRSIYASTRMFARERYDFFHSHQGSSIGDLSALQRFLYDEINVNIRDLFVGFYPTVLPFIAGEAILPVLDARASTLTVTIRLLALPPGHYALDRTIIEVKFAEAVIGFSDARFQAIIRLLHNFSIISNDAKPHHQVVETPGFREVSNSSVNLEVLNDLVDRVEHFYSTDTKGHPTEEDLFFDAATGEDFKEADAPPQFTSSQPDLFELPSELFPMISKYESVSVRLKISVTHPEFILLEETAMDSVSLEKLRVLGAITTVDPFIFELIDFADRMCLSFQLFASKMRWESVPESEVSPATSELFDFSSFCCRITYHSASHPQLPTVLDNMKLLVGVNFSDLNASVSEYALASILAYSQRTFPTKHNKFLSKEQRYPPDEASPFKSQITVTLSNVYLRPVLQREPQRLMITAAAEKVDVKIILLPEDFYVSVALPDGVVIFTLLKELPLLCVNTVQVTLKGPSVSVATGNINVFLDFESIFYVWKCLSCSLKSLKALTDDEKAGKQKLSLQFVSFTVDLPLDTDSPQHVLSVKFGAIQMDRSEADSLSMSVASLSLLAMNQPVLEETPIQVRVFENEFSTTEVSVDFSGPTNFSFSEVSYFLTLNRIIYGVDCIRSFLAYGQSPVLSAKDGVVDLYVSLKIPSISVGTTVGNTDYGKILVSDFSLFASHFDDSTLRLEGSFKNIVCLSPEAVQFAKSEARNSFSYCIQRDTQHHVRIDLDSFRFTAPLFYFMRLKVLFLDSRTLPLRETFFAPKIAASDTQLSVQLRLFRSRLIIEEAGVRSLIVSLNDLVLEKLDALKISIPTVKVYYDNGGEKNIAIIRKFPISVLVVSPTPNSQHVTVTIGAITLHHSQLDFAGLRSLLLDRFLLNPEAATIYIEPDVLCDQRATILFKGISCFFVDVTVPYFWVRLGEFRVSIGNWSYQPHTTIEALINVEANLFNSNSSTWEPLFEAWSFTVRRKNISTLQSLLQVSADRVLEINLTPYYLIWMQKFSSYLQRSRKVESIRKVAIQFLVRNTTGYTIEVWNESDLDTRKQIKDSAESLVSFYEMEEKFVERDHLVSNALTLNAVLLNTGWEPIYAVSLTNQGSRVHILQSKASSIDKHRHRLVVEIAVENDVKIVSFRSPYRYFNFTELEVEIQILRSDFSIIQQNAIAPRSYLSVPIEYAFDCFVRIRPNAQHFDFSDQSISWKDFDTTEEALVITCSRSTESNPPFYFSFIPTSATSESDLTENTLCLNYPLMTINVCTPLRICNLLPYPIRLSLSAQHDFSFNSDTIGSGSFLSCHDFDISKVVLLSSLSVATPTDVAPFGIQRNSVVICNNPNDEYELDERLEFYSAEIDRTLTILLQHENEDCGGRVLYLIPPILFYNRTEKNIFLREKKILRKPNDHSILGVLAGNSDQSPFLLPIPTEPEDLSVQLSLDSQIWSNVSINVNSVAKTPLNLAVGGLQANVSSSLHRNVLVNVDTGAGIFFRSVVVQIFNMFFIRNLTDRSLSFCSSFSGDSSFGLVHAEPKETVPFHTTQHPQNKSLPLYIAIRGSKQWSTFINVSDTRHPCLSVSSDEDTSILINLEYIRNPIGFLEILLRTERIWPFLIVNESAFPMLLSQKNSSQTHRINAKASTNYTLDLPYEEHVVFLMIEDHIQDFVIDRIGIIPNFQVRFPDASDCWFSISVKTKGPSFVVTIKDVTQKVRQDFRSNYSEYTDAEKRLVSEIKISFSEVGIVFYSQDLEEFLYARISDISLTLENYDILSKLSLNVRWLQVDNQLFLSKYPVCICPKTLSVEESFQHPLLTIKVKKTLHSEFNFSYFDQIIFAIADLSISMDDRILAELILYMRQVSLLNATVTKGEPVTSLNFLIPSSFLAAIPTGGEANHEQEIYVGTLFIDSFNVALNFSSSEGAQNRLLRVIGAKKRVQTFFYQYFASAQDVSYRLGSIRKTNFLGSRRDLISSLISNYKQHIGFDQHFSLIFKTDVFAFLDVFYKVVAALKYVKRNNIKVLPAIRSISTSLVSGVASAGFKYANFLGKFLILPDDRVDDAYRDRRNFRLTQSVPSNFFDGFLMGLVLLMDSFLSGARGMVQEPVHRFYTDGIRGLFQGVWNGSFALVVKTMVGACDFGNKFFRGVFESVEERDVYEKVRYPKVKPFDSALQRYSIKEAYGQFLLRLTSNGLFFQSIYVAHVDILCDKSVCVLHVDGIACILRESLGLLWNVPISLISACTQSLDKIVIAFRDEGTNRFRYLLIPDDSTRVWFLAKIVHHLEGIWNAAN